MRFEDVLSSYADKRILITGGSGFIGSKKVCFEVLNCVRSGEAYAGH
jgi:FlaA1/EpsC-like NDP-sugar epimerase